VIAPLPLPRPLPISLFFFSSFFFNGLERKTCANPPSHLNQVTFELFSDGHEGRTWSARHDRSFRTDGEALKEKIVDKLN